MSAYLPNVAISISTEFQFDFFELPAFKVYLRIYLSDMFPNYLLKKLENKKKRKKRLNNTKGTSEALMQYVM